MNIQISRLHRFALTLLFLLTLAFVLPAPAQAQSAIACSQYYTVQRGDTLYSIGRRFGVSATVLQNLNNLSNPNRIYAGQRLCVASGSPSDEILVDQTPVQFILALTDVRIRKGPGTNYPIIERIYAGQMGAVTGITKDDAWWRVVCPDNTVGNCFVSALPSLTQPASAVGSGVERIQFAPGAFAKTVAGSVQGVTRKEYLLQARAGQTMEIQLTSAGEVNFALEGVSDGQLFKRIEVGDPYWKGVLPLGQDYRIRVGTPSDYAQHYTLTVTIR
ncbi:MAG: LysM peptidoglycan-binding domain-containing protein [Caldilineaceae bacterium]